MGEAWNRPLGDSFGIIAFFASGFIAYPLLTRGARFGADWVGVEARRGVH